MNKDKNESIFEKQRKKREEKEQKILEQQGYEGYEKYLKKRFFMDLIFAVIAFIFYVAVMVIGYIFHPAYAICMIVILPIIIYYGKNDFLRIKATLKKIENEREVKK